ncbi:(5-formylfuran-3-yl)methyl phosphate synthase [Variovorax sp. DT-64]|uniref:(5-formylfuran-3-yl)methyl phosphate synthase n=1 Tax=Variovorax sp. DT-64 TaxID=3396160 RepID=UPI003F1B7230
MTTTRMLVSVRSVPEALIAAAGGADFIDLKEPGEGALGGLPVATIATVVAALRAQAIARPVSATIGDLPMHALPRILAQVEAVDACGVDYVKVGIERGPEAFAVLDALAEGGWPVVPVFVADRGLDPALVAHACCGLAFPALMVDTADKQAGSLFDAVPLVELRRFVAQVRTSGRLVGLAGALRTMHLPSVLALAPDFAGFRSAVCIGDRKTALCPERLAALAGLLHGQAAVEPAPA